MNAIGKRALSTSMNRNSFTESGRCPWRRRPPLSPENPRPRSGGCLNCHSVAQALKAADRSSKRGLAVSFIEIVWSQILVKRPVTKHVVDDCQQRVRHGYDGSFRTPPGGHAPVLSSEIASTGPGSAPRGLDHHRTKPAISMAGPTAQSFSRALLIAGTKPRPGNKMGRCREAAHVSPDFGQNVFRHAPTDTRDRVQPIQ